MSATNLCLAISVKGGALAPSAPRACAPDCVLPNNCSHLTLLKMSCSIDLGRWFATQLHYSNRFWSIRVKFSGLACLDMKNSCGNFRCKQTSTRKVIALAFIHVNPHPAY